MATTTGYIDYTEQTTPASPSASHQRLFVRSSDHALCVVNSSGTVTAVGSAATPAYRGCRATNSAVQSISNTTYTGLTFDTEEFDTDAIHSTASNQSRFTVPSGMDGKWRFTASVCFAPSSGGTARYVKFRKNGATDLRAFAQGTSPAFSTTVAACTISVEVLLAATDYVEVVVYQDTGGSLNVGGTGADTGSSMSATFIGT
jgi:hypothetical protein